MKASPGVDILRRPAALLTACALLSLAVQCKREAVPPAPSSTSSTVSSPAPAPATGDASGPTIVRDPGPMPAPDAVVAKGQGLLVTLGDFETSMRRSLLFAPPGPDGKPYQEVPAERLASPHLHITVVQSLVASRLAEARARELGLNISVQDEIAQAKAMEPLAPYAALLAMTPEAALRDTAHEGLRQRGLTVEDVRAIVREEIVRERLPAALLQSVSDEQLWESYERSMNKIDLLLVSAFNTPSSQEIDAFLQADAQGPRRIEAFFAQHPQRFTVPPVVVLTMLRVPAPSEDAPGAAPKAGESLGARLLQASERLTRGEGPEEVAKALGLVLEQDANLLREENKRAFESAKGATGFEVDGPRGAYAWRVEGHQASKPMELIRSVRREIAAELLREKGVVPSVSERLQKARVQLARIPHAKAGPIKPELVASAQEALKPLGLELQHTGLFVYEEQGFIPRHGLAEEVVRKAFAMPAGTLVSDVPVVSRNRAYVFRVLDRTRASREGFAGEKEAFRKAFLEQRQGQVVQEYVSQRSQELGVSFDTRPLRIKYGVVQKTP